MSLFSVNSPAKFVVLIMRNYKKERFKVPAAKLWNKTTPEDTNCLNSVFVMFNVFFKCLEINSFISLDSEILSSGTAVNNEC